MNTPATRGEQARQFYNAAATTSTGFSFMNYGFGPLSADLATSQEPERYCLQLYRHLLGNADLAGKRVVEVSCGRGGGAAHLAHVYRPSEYVGIDISDENVRLASERFSKITNLRFKVGNAEHLPLSAGTAHAVINVEAAHLYDSPTKFFAEVLRILENGGTFFHADLAWQDRDPSKVISDSGLKIVSVEDITANVLQSLEADSERRESIVASFPVKMQNDFRDWSGVKGYRAYNRFKSGEWIYRVIRATG
jgi:ubiquinone/menaquinone biosynthesis C-methylase UbiE